VSADEMRAEVERLRTENARLRATTIRSRYTAATVDPLARSRKPRWQQEQVSAIRYECGCRQYVDVLTPGRWAFYGYTIKPGEGTIDMAGRNQRARLYCRCQIQPNPDLTAYLAGCLDDSAEIPF
jgi:hypothetical protein